MVFDARFLKNPHYEDELRALTGQDAPIGEFIDRDPDFASYFGNLTSLLEPLLPRFSAEGKSYLTIAVGCTGGKHRSVYIAEKLNDWLTEQGERVIINHRDLNRER